MQTTSPSFTTAQHQVYEEWKRYGHHVKEYLSEFIGTAFLLFFVVGVVATMFGTGSPVPHLIPSQIARLFIAGLMLGSVGWIVAVSPPGKLSGAHVNPAITTGFLVLGKMHLKDAVGYVVSQMCGAIVGALLGHDVFARLGQGTKSATLVPGPSVSVLIAFAAEVVTTFILAYTVYTCVSRKTLMRYTPAIATVAVGILVAADGQISGCGMNPARWFGPAWTMHFWANATVYTLGPIVGAVSAALLRRVAPPGRRVPQTAKLFHDHRYRSLFKDDSVPTKLPSHVEKQASQQ